MQYTYYLLFIAIFHIFIIIIITVVIMIVIIIIICTIVKTYCSFCDSMFFVRYMTKDSRRKSLTFVSCNMMENITRVFSEKGKMLLVLNNYSFYRDQITQSGVKWRCILKSNYQQLEFNPSIIVSDFEQSIHVASKVVWPFI